MLSGTKSIRSGKDGLRSDCRTLYSGLLFPHQVLVNGVTFHVGTSCHFSGFRTNQEFGAGNWQKFVKYS